MSFLLHAHDRTKGSASSDHEDTKWKEKTLDYRRSLDVTLKQCDRLQKEHEALMEEAQKADEAYFEAEFNRYKAEYREVLEGKAREFRDMLEKSYLARINELEAQLGQYTEDEPATPTTRNADNEGNVSEDDAAIIKEETDAPQIAGSSMQNFLEVLAPLLPFKKPGNFATLRVADVKAGLTLGIYIQMRKMCQQQCKSLPLQLLNRQNKRVTGAILKKLKGQFKTNLEAYSDSWPAEWMLWYILKCRRDPRLSKTAIG